MRRIGGGLKDRDQKLIFEKGDGSWSRREVLSRGAGLVCALALPQLLMQRAFSQTATFDYYISPSGSDSNPGTQSSPWAITSLVDTSANNKKIAGKRVGLLPGTYSLASMQSGSTPNDYQHPILHLPAGSTASPTTVASVTPRAAILNWTGNSSANSVIGQNQGQQGNWVIDGLTIKGQTSANSCKMIGYYPAGGAGPVTIQNCDMGSQAVSSAAVGSNDGAIFCQGHVNLTISNNYFHDIHKPAQIDHVHAFIEYSGTGTKFIYNTVENCDTGIDGKVNDNGALVAYNYFYATGTGGSFCAPIQGYDGDQNSANTPNSFHHNIFDSCGPVHKCDVNSVSAQKFSWYNNTVYDTRSGSIEVWDLRASVGGALTFHDNITMTTAATGGSEYGRIAVTSGDVALCDYNCYSYSNSTGGWGISGSLIASLVSWLASGFDRHGITSNPKFASAITPGAGPNQFKLGSGSPCIGTGTGGINMGAWDGTVTQIGAGFLSGVTTPTPDSPRLTVS
jgi:hypothetical protein